MADKFKVGDRVKFLKTYAAKPGAIAVVQGYTDNDWGTRYLEVVWDRTNGLASNQCNGGYNETDFELVAQPVFIVIDEEDNVTAEWRSLDDAERDARLSAEQASVGFTVYQRIVAFGVKTEVVETRG